MDKEDPTPNYPRAQSVSLLCNCYNHFGASVQTEVIEKSILENSLGKLPEAWNVGLFRFLDEAIYLVKILGYYALAQSFQNKAHRSQMILCHQVEKNLLAIRVLCASGLDGSARQNLRALYEMCLALCRCQVDSEFSTEFNKQPTLKSSNEFWHKFMAKQKTEKFLQEFNENSEDKCFLTVGDFFGDAYKVLGVGAHPNYHGWVFDWQGEFSDPEGMDQMFHFSPKLASEVVLATTSQLAFATLSFVSPKIAGSGLSMGLLKNNPMFKHYGDDLQAVASIGKISSLMFLMLVKLINRNKSNFDPNTHF